MAAKSGALLVQFCPVQLYPVQLCQHLHPGRGCTRAKHIQKTWGNMMMILHISCMIYLLLITPQTAETVRRSHHGDNDRSSKGPCHHVILLSLWYGKSPAFLERGHIKEQMALEMMRNWFHALITFLNLFIFKI